MYQSTPIRMPDDRIPRCRGKRGGDGGMEGGLNDTLCANHRVWDPGVLEGEVLELLGKVGIKLGGGAGGHVR